MAFKNEISVVVIVASTIQDEWYTSKTCSMCGCKNENLGGSKIFNCNKCKITMDRDYNGARNIMLKSLSS